MARSSLWTDPSGKLIATLSNMMDDMMHAQGGMSMGMGMSMSSSSIGNE
ncbi:Two-component sensor histidine kinase [Desulfosporosinus sp. I2]|nr:Two-component sensor histidine kinase [Desulfosporosinus sp. I2]